MGRKYFSFDFYLFYDVWYYLVSVYFFKKVYVIFKIGYVICDMDCYNKYLYFIE